MNETTTQAKRISAAQQPEQVRSGRIYTPVVDIIEHDDELLLLADVPGAQADGIDIHYERGELALTARVAPRQGSETAYLLNEYGVGDFVRRFQVGDGIDPSRIQAEVKSGVLTLHLPKAASARTRKIAVKAG